jgi:hypothetical protein
MAIRTTTLIVLMFSALALAQTTPDIVTVPLRAFNAGELSPLMEGRTDYPKYDQGLRQCLNLLPMTQGPVTRRPGTKLIETTKSNGVARLIPFEYSVEDAYILEFGEYYMRVYRNGAQVLSGGSAYEIVTPFDADELPDIQFVQSANTMYLVDGNDPPQVLTRTAHTNWDINDVNFTTGPFLPRDTSGTTIAASAVSGTATLTASTPLFQSGHVGSLFKLYHRRASTSVSGVLDANEASATLSISGAYNATTHGTWTGHISLERSYDSGSTWDSVKTIASTNDNNLNTSDIETDPDVIYRLEMTNFISGSATFTISALDYLDYGVVKVTAYTDPCTVTAIVLDTLVSTSATAIWQEGYWSDYRGWPRTIEFHEQRLWFGGSTNYPQTLWAGKTAASEGDYENMTTGTLASSALVFTLPGRNPIQWLHSQGYLVVGTAGGVGRIGNLTEAITPSNVEYRLQTSNGAERIQPVAVGDVLLYVERGAKKIRQYLYSIDADQFIAPDISIIATHIPAVGLNSMALQSSPQPVVWMVRADGSLATMTYLKEQEVAAWARQTTNGTFESLAVIPGAVEDEVWAVVKRTLPAGTVERCVEQFQPVNWGTDSNDCWFLDSGLTTDANTPVSAVSFYQGSSATVTLGTGKYTNGDQVRITGIVGMTELNDNVYTLKGRTLVTPRYRYDLYDETGVVRINSSAFHAYVRGGTIQRVENTFPGLSHLTGETVAIWSSGGYYGDVEVTAGVVTTDDWLDLSKPVVIGLPYTSIFETMPLCVPAQLGSLGRTTKRITLVAVDFYQTVGPKIGADVNHLVDVVKEPTLSEAVPELYTEWKEVGNVEGGWNRKPTIWIEQTIPGPMTIRQIEVQMRVNR